jgi:hypothetical protein
MKIYTTVAPTPSRVVALIRLLAGLGGTAPRRRVGQLFDPIAPEWGAGVEPDAVREVVQACEEIGLVEQSGDRGAEILALTPNLPTPPTDPLPVVLAAQTLRPRTNVGENHFATACAWLLAQPVAGGPQGHNAIQTRLQRSGFDPKEIGLTNPARIDMVLYWARYLGLIRRLRETGGSGVVPDPTEFLRRHLGRLLPRPDPVPAVEFRRTLGLLCPVLDGGEVRDRVLARMKGAGLPARPADQLSDALSLALRRLRAEGIVHWTYPDDADEFLNLSRDERAAFIARGPRPTREAT